MHNEMRSDIALGVERVEESIWGKFNATRGEEKIIFLLMT